MFTPPILASLWVCLHCLHGLFTVHGLVFTSYCLQDFISGLFVWFVYNCLYYIVYSFWSCVYIISLFISEPLFMFFCLFYVSHAFLFAFSCLHFLAPIVCIHNCLLIVWTLILLSCLYSLYSTVCTFGTKDCLHPLLFAFVTLSFSNFVCICPFLCMYSIVYVSHSFEDCLHPSLFPSVTLTHTLSRTLFAFIALFACIAFSHFTRLSKLFAPIIVCFYHIYSLSFS